MAAHQQGRKAAMTVMSRPQGVARTSKVKAHKRGLAPCKGGWLTPPPFASKMVPGLLASMAQSRYDVIYCSSSRSETNEFIIGVIIERVDYTKFLGVLIDSKLNWKKHIDYIRTKISKGIGIMNHVKRNLTKETLTLLYFTLIYPPLSYCIILWGAACRSIIEPLLILQKRAVRYCTGSRYRAASNPLFTSLKVRPTFIFLSKFC